MLVNIKRARKKDATDCLKCIKGSLLWDAYFKDNSNPDLMKEAIERKEIYGAYNSNDKCIGIMGVIEKGCFGKFYYLSLLKAK